MANPVPKYSIWEAMSTALSVGMRALSEVRALAREPGPAGPEGKLPLVKEWEDRLYREREVVAHRGSTYQAGKDTGKEPPHADWTCLARAGSDGRDLEVEGTFDPTRAYRRLSLVALNGGSFIARQDNPGPCPGEGWQLLASRGKSGPPGNPGTPGKGNDGPPGPPVIALSIEQETVLTIVNADGSTVQLDLYPLLSKLQG